MPPRQSRIVAARGFAVQVQQIEEMDVARHRFAQPPQFAQGCEDLGLFDIGLGNQHRNFGRARIDQRFEQPPPARTHFRLPQHRISARRGIEIGRDQPHRLEPRRDQPRARRVEAQGADRAASCAKRAGDLGVWVGIGGGQALRHQIAPACFSAAILSSS